jgi:hypothetical protein
LSATAAARARRLFADMVARKSASFANARDVRNMFERAVSEHANRLAKVPEPSKVELMTLEPEDLG